MIETVTELHKANMKGAGKSSEKNAKPTNFYPKILLIGNKKDLK